MYYNLNESMYAYERSNMKKYNNLMTTKITSQSFDMGTHFVSVLGKILEDKIRKTEKDIFGKLKQQRKKQSMPKQMLLFINHCATMIQSNFRGYQQRKYYRMFKPVLQRFRELLLAVVMGWKVRRVMQTSHIEKKCKKIKQQSKKQNFREVRITKRQMIQDIAYLLKRGNWLQYYEGNKKQKQKMKATNIKVALASKSTTNINKPKNQQTRNNSTNKKQVKGNEKPIQHNENPSQMDHQSQIMTNHYMKEQEIPIKATGFYNIPGQFPVPQPKESQNKRKINVANKKKSKPKQISKTLDETKNIVKNQQKKQQQKELPRNTAQQKTKKVNKPKQISNKEKQQLEVSSLTINLPMQQVQFHESIIIPIKTIQKQQMKEFISASSGFGSPQNDSKQSTQKMKRTNRGIRVTLSTNQFENPIQEKKAYEIPQQRKEDTVKDELQQIIQVYNTSYMNKNIEIKDKLNYMKTKRKFVS